MRRLLTSLSTAGTSIGSEVVRPARSAQAQRKGRSGNSRGCTTASTSRLSSRVATRNIRCLRCATPSRSAFSTFRAVAYPSLIRAFCIRGKTWPRSSRMPSTFSTMRCVGRTSSARRTSFNPSPLRSSRPRVWLLKFECPWHGGPPINNSTLPSRRCRIRSLAVDFAPGARSMSDSTKPQCVVAPGKARRQTRSAASSESTASRSSNPRPSPRAASAAPSDIIPQPEKRSTARTGSPRPARGGCVIRNQHQSNASSAEDRGAPLSSGTDERRTRPSTRTLRTTRRPPGSIPYDSTGQPRFPPAFGAALASCASHFGSRLRINIRTRSGGGVSQVVLCLWFHRADCCPSGRSLAPGPAATRRGYQPDWTAASRRWRLNRRSRSPLLVRRISRRRVRIFLVFTDRRGCSLHREESLPQCFVSGDAVCSVGCCTRDTAGIPGDQLWW